MDPESYKQLMLCLKQVKTVKAEKVDKGTDSKKVTIASMEFVVKCFK